MMADADEFSWFSEKVGLKEFLRKHSELSYLSFGKWMYSMRHSVDTDTNTFGLEKVRIRKPCSRIEDVCSVTDQKATWIGTHAYYTNFFLP
jgi:hypothetical protein